MENLGKASRPPSDRQRPCRVRVGTPRQGGSLREQRRGARHAAEEQVQRDVGGLPGRRLDDLAAVVALEPRLLDHEPLTAGARRRAHGRLPRKTVMPTPANAAAAAPTCFHMEPRSRVVTTGSGGRPYTSGSSSSRKKAPSPPTPSSGSRP